MPCNWNESTRDDRRKAPFYAFSLLASSDLSGNGIWGLGCIACNVYHGPAPDLHFASFTMRRWPLQRSLFIQHDGTHLHQVAIGAVDDAEREAPTNEEFQKVLEALLKRDSAGGSFLRPEAGRKKIAHAVVLARSRAPARPHVFGQGAEHLHHARREEIEIVDSVQMLVPD